MHWQQNWVCLGNIVQEKLDDGRSVFMLTTAESQDDIVAICSFVLDPDDLKITHARSFAGTSRRHEADVTTR